ncbi:MAG: ABC transporter substrate-binding protein [Candidatus Electrothrix sp. ATG2]|nr:ABC transporter substrate-binding protein [Candidatus Electrothrix sp. ATG2]
MKLSKIMFFGMSVLFAITMIFPVNAFSDANPKFKWTLVTSWPENFPILHDAVVKFANDVEILSKGELKIEVFSAGKREPALEVFHAVSEGRVEMGHSCAYYWDKEIPGSSFMTTVPFGMTAKGNNAWFFSGGGLQLWRELYQPYGVIPFPMGNTGVQMGGWFKKRIESVSDFNGLRMRIPGLGGRVLERLGVQTKLLAAGDIFKEFEQGTLDAAEWIGPYHDEQLRLYRVADYYYYPGWHEPGTTFELIVNSKEWDNLPENIKRVIEVTSGNLNQWIYSQFEARNIDALKVLIEERGVTVLPYPQEVLDVLHKKTKELLQEEAGKNAQFKKIYKEFSTFKEKYNEWNLVADDAYRSGATATEKAVIFQRKIAKAVSTQVTADIKREEATVKITMVGDVSFDIGSSEIKTDLFKELIKISDIIKQTPHSKIHISGHTDSTGSLNKNMELSKKRAEEIKKLLVFRGFDEKNITATGYADSKPIASNNTNAGRKKNRRVEIGVTPQ